MRELIPSELTMVAGGDSMSCGPIPENANEVGDTLTTLYEEAIDFTSYVIGRVANAL